jgi:formiminotetrahydrofolate cyclodeaminase
VKSEAFAQYPPALLEGLTEEEKASRQELYQRALQEAQAVARMSLPERNLLGSSN